jgi:hypothetical protein
LAVAGGRAAALAGTSWASISSATPAGPPASSATAAATTAAASSASSPPPPSDAQEWPELTTGLGCSSGTASPQQQDAGDSVGTATAPLVSAPSRSASLNGATTMAEQLARAQTKLPGRTPERPKKLLPLSSPAKLKPLGRAPSGSLRSPSAPPLPEPAASAAPAAAANSKSSSTNGVAGSYGGSAAAAAAAAESAAAAVSKVAPNGLAAGKPHASESTRAGTVAVQQADKHAVQAAGPSPAPRVIPLRQQAQQARVVPSDGGSKPASKLRPPPGFSEPSASLTSTVAAAVPPFSASSLEPGQPSAAGPQKELRVSRHTCQSAVLPRFENVLFAVPLGMTCRELGQCM